MNASNIQDEPQKRCLCMEAAHTEERTWFTACMSAYEKRAKVIRGDTSQKKE